MRSFLDAKAMAKTLRQELKSRNLELGHSECLEVVAKQFGFRDWNTMAVELEGPTPVDSPTLLPLPSDWEISGTQKSAFEVGVVPHGSPDQGNAIVLQSKPGEGMSGSEWCCCYPSAFSAEKYRGKTVEFSANLRCENLNAESYIWFRIDDEFQERITYIGRWEIPEENVLTGTRDWHRQSISILVPEKAAAMYFGVTHYGQGTTWLANISFGETSAKDTRIRTRVPATPQNLDLKVA